MVPKKNANNVEVKAITLNGIPLVNVMVMVMAMVMAMVMVMVIGDW